MTESSADENNSSGDINEARQDGLSPSSSNEDDASSPPLSLSSSINSEQLLPNNDGNDESSSSSPDVNGTTNNNNDSNTNNNSITSKLNRELSLASKHHLQLQSQWRHILSIEKFNELQSSLPTIIQYHNENISRKLTVIQSLTKEIQCLQDLYQTAMVANMNRMEDLIMLHDETCVKLDNEFHLKVNVLQSTLRDDVTKISIHYEKEKEVVRQSIQCQLSKDDEQLQILNEQHEHDLQEIESRNSEQLNSIQLSMTSRISELQHQTELVNNEHAASTNPTLTTYHELKSRDTSIRSDIATKTSQANKLQRTIQHIQLITAQESIQLKDRHTELLARKSRAISKWNIMQDTMNKYRNVQQSKLVELIKRANETKEGLEQQCKHAEKVKKLSLECNKYESSREKFATLLRERDASSSSSSAAASKDDMESKTFIINCMTNLGDSQNHFWNKYNTTKLNVHQIERKLRQLQSQQAKLQSKLTSYDNGISINNTVLKERNPLFVINGKMNMPNHYNKMKLLSGNDGCGGGDDGSKGGKGGGRGKKVMMRRRTTVVDGNHYLATNIRAQAVK